jgi:Ca2+/Na+ antiporter
MSNETDVLLKFCEEQWAQARQSENQRSTMANFLISIFTAGMGIIIIADFALKTLPIAFFLLLIGAFGGLFSMKLFERWRLHENRAVKWSEQIDKLNPDAKLLELFWEAHQEHKENHPKMRKLALYRLWGLFYLLMTALAAVLLIYIILTNNLI